MKSDFISGMGVGVIIMTVVSVLIVKFYTRDFQKQVIEAGCGYYNADDNFVIKKINEVMQ